MVVILVVLQLLWLLRGARGWGWGVLGRCVPLPRIGILVV